MQILKKIKFSKKSENLEKKSKNDPKIHQNGLNDPQMTPKMLKLTPKIQILKKIKNFKNVWKSRKKSKIHPKLAKIHKNGQNCAKNVQVDHKNANFEKI